MNARGIFTKKSTPSNGPFYVLIFFGLYYGTIVKQIWTDSKGEDYTKGDAGMV